MGSIHVRNAIRKAFVELSHAKPVANITVKEIADKALINRSTFYHYYSDVFDLLSDCLLEGTQLERRSIVADDGMIADVIGRMEESLQFAKQHTALQKAALQMLFTSPYLADYYEKNLLFTLMLIDELAGNEKEGLIDRGLLAEFCIAGVARMQVVWIDGGMRTPVEQLARTIAVALVQTICANMQVEAPEELIPYLDAPGV